MAANPSMTRKVIYDFGSNNGDDIPYYLKKADVVVAVEANPMLCERIRQRFSGEIASGKLHMESCVVTTDDSSDQVYFYIHKFNHVLSQFPAPTDDVGAFEKILLPSKSVLDIIAAHGEPYYIKIDIEHYDQAILAALFANDIRPPFISAESHSIEVFSLLVSQGNYRAYKLVDGNSVSTRYKDCSIRVNGSTEQYSFPHHSAGPFGEDVAGDWLNAENFFKLLAYEKLGWKDIHATNIFAPNDDLAPTLGPYVVAAIKDEAMTTLRTALPKPVKQLIKRVLQMH
ncbi:MAG: FkbM family methyltransferase [Proteobacteria bacterium]|nr:FkbM family methyltransferase [Pseudomonadota bacterium]